MISRRPLLGTAADQRLFIADDSRRKAIEAIGRSRNVLISGVPGSGKTSLLHSALFHAREGRRPAVLLSGRLVKSSRELVDALAILAAEESWIPEPSPPSPADPLGVARQVRHLRDAPEDALVLADDLSVEQARTLFGQLRDELWQTPLRFATAVRPDVAQALSTPPADAFFDMRVTLEPFTQADARRFLKARDDAGETGEEALINIGTGEAMQPRVLAALASGARLNARLQHELTQIAHAEAGRPGAMLLAEIWGREGVSASDVELQDSLGVTRNRLTELLRGLADAGVLESHTEPREGKIGRPRTIYTVKDR